MRAFLIAAVCLTFCLAAETPARADDYGKKACIIHPDKVGGLISLHGSTGIYDGKALVDLIGQITTKCGQGSIIAAEISTVVERTSGFEENLLLSLCDFRLPISKEGGFVYCVMGPAEPKGIVFP